MLETNLFKVILIQKIKPLIHDPLFLGLFTFDKLKFVGFMNVVNSNHFIEPHFALHHHMSIDQFKV
jgi:hypothetical protein